MRATCPASPRMLLQDMLAPAAYKLTDSPEAHTRQMPILGVGTDIVEADRIRGLLEREPRFAERVFTDAELAYSRARTSGHLHLAARFAAKEAVAKALGRSFSWKEVEMVNGSDGRPQIVLHGRAEAAAGDAVLHLSVSHTRHYATAVVVVEAGE